MHVLCVCGLCVVSSRFGVLSRISEIMRFKRHVPPNLRAYILDTTMS